MSLHHGWLDRCSGKSVPISDGPEKGQPQPDRQLEKASDALDTLRIDVKAAAATVQEEAEELIAAGLENKVFVCRTAYSTEDGAYDIVLTCKCSSSVPLWLLPKPQMMMGGKMVGQVRLVDGWALHRPLQDHQPQRPRDGLPARHGACALLPDA